MEYLEDRFPEPPLRPAGPEARARVCPLQIIGELQIMIPLVELSRQVDPARRHPPGAAVWLMRLVTGLSSLQAYVGGEPFCGRSAVDAGRLRVGAGSVHASKDRGCL
ncbi:hypothetical protein [Methylocella sp.]|jgi:maleylpyruvate isomerase|uniref:hypothetical protein n=1 Tax=Methylocella sp. TaxID=1978226 RepID=UPI003C131CE3